jgi:hypothetical protein
MVKDDGHLITECMTLAKWGSSSLRGDVAVADGSMQDEFSRSFSAPSTWIPIGSTTIAETNGKWNIINLRLSSNVFANPLLMEQTRALCMQESGRGGGRAHQLVLLQKRQAVHCLAGYPLTRTPLTDKIWEVSAFR